MAEGLMRHALKGKAGFEVLSAGLNTGYGQRPSEHSVCAMRELGMDISSIRSQPVTADLVKRSDVIFVMTHGHKRSLLSMFPTASSKTFLLREMEDGVAEEEQDVPDPIGQSYSVYLDCRDAIQSAIPSLLKFMQNQAQPPSGKTSSPRKIRLAMGADHGGVELKAALKADRKSTRLNSSH